jgi:hypothetical protein
MALSSRARLEDLVFDSAHPKAPQQLKDDRVLALKWLDVGMPADLRPASIVAQIRPEHYERWSAGLAKISAIFCFGQPRAMPSDQSVRLQHLSKS